MWNFCSDEIIVLCATGTAARVNVTYDPASSTRIPPPAPAVVQEKPPAEKERDKKLYVDVNLANSAAQGSLHALYDHRSVMRSVLRGLGGGVNVMKVFTFSLKFMLTCIMVHGRQLMCCKAKLHLIVTEFSLVNKITYSVHLNI